MAKTTDRRSGEDRRVARRFGVEREIQWESATGRRTDTLGDVSDKGCFILSGEEVNPGDVISIYFPLSDGNSVEFKGTVTNYAVEIGFGVEFIEMTEAREAYLKSFAEVNTDN